MGEGPATAPRRRGAPAEHRPARTAPTGNKTDSRKFDHSPEAAEKRFRVLAENAVVGIFQTDIQGRILWLNPAAARVAGYDSPDEMIAAVPDIRAIYVNPDEREVFTQAVRESGSTTDFEYRIRRKDGSIRWLSVCARAVEFPGGVSGFEGTVTDVTDRRLVEAALNAVSSGLDPQLAITSFSEVLREVIPFVQLSLTVIEGDAYRRLVSIGDRPGDFPADERIPIEDNAVGVVLETAAPVVVGDTSLRQFAYDERLEGSGLGSYVILPLRGPRGVFGTLNIGFREPFVPTVVMVSTLSSLVAAIAQGVSNILLFEQQRETIRRLEEVDQLKDEFVATIAHDLRSPLSTVVGMAELLRTRWTELADKDRLDMAETIEDNAAALAQFAEEVLDVAALDSGRFRFEVRPFDMSALLKRTAAHFRAGSGGRQIKVQIQPGMPSPVGDERRTWQVLTNLISNALKFSSADDPVEIAAARSSEGVEVSVRDFGSGIEPDRLGAVFDRFTRLSSNHGSPSGAGLGLYISRSMVEAQGGRLWVTSTPGEGSIFSFSLPCTNGG
jgi:PAS domain S-box-containing protein